MARVLVADPIDSRGIDRLIAAGHQVDVRKGLTEDELVAVVGDYEAMIVRSETRVTARIIEHATKMVGIGRAGVGVDNIDVDAATQYGIAVVNAPTGNTIAAAEHAFALMMSLARNIPQADASMRRGEWMRSRFMGVELRNKTLGLIGLGRVGSEVALRARAFQMHVIAYDPYISQERVRSLGVEAVSMEQLLQQSDFISIHTPLTAGTKSLLGEREFALLKPGVRIVNAARGGLVDEHLLHKALADGAIAGAALDVFPEEPPKDLALVKDGSAVLTPHLGASTEEAHASNSRHEEPPRRARVRAPEPGVRIVNAARGGLVDEHLLHKALADGAVAGAALDVFPEEPPKDLALVEDGTAVLTPHLGASTEEAQVEVAFEVVDQLIAILNGSAAPHTINMPFVPPEVREALGPYLPVATTMARIAIQLVRGQLESVTVRVAGEIAQYDIDILSSAALVGVLNAATDVRVNLVNAPAMAHERGIKVIEEKDPEGDEEYVNLVGVEVRSTVDTSYLAGTSVHGRVHLLRVNDFYLDMEPSAPYMLFTTHTDQPGIIGKLGTIAGEHDVNISFMEVGRAAPRGAATMIVGFDDPVTDEMLADIRAIDGMAVAKIVENQMAEAFAPRLRGA